MQGVRLGELVTKRRLTAIRSKHEFARAARTSVRERRRVEQEVAETSRRLGSRPQAGEPSIMRLGGSSAVCLKKKHPSGLQFPIIDVIPTHRAYGYGRCMLTRFGVAIPVDD